MRTISSPSLDRSQRGAALVVVLSLLLLMTVLILAFFAAVETETQTSASNQNQATLRGLSDLPLQLIETQVRAATTYGQPERLSDAVYTWTSQPGLMRVINRRGELERAYKLYSSSRMEINRDEFNDAYLEAEVDPDWTSEPNRWVNLNEPFRSVLNPDRQVWPILNPAATRWSEGLQIRELGDDGSGALPVDPLAEMPVEWLYVLEGGRVVSFNELEQAAGSGESMVPIGRIAFWTDDESCKINVNTAGERTNWKVPASNHPRRFIYSRNQPSTGEFNAYPGHPASVSLSAVFRKALPENISETDLIRTMLELTPRYRFGGSENATRKIWDRSDEWQKDHLLNVNKSERLYATSSEFLFNIARDVNNPALQEPIEESGFLLTDSSRAPELNAYGLPRVGIWPLDTDPDKQSIHDKMIGRALTIGGKPYFFQRHDPLSTSEATSIERNGEILDYLDRLTQQPVNGEGGNFETKWGTGERRQILTQIFDYVRAATNLSDTSWNYGQYDRMFTPATSARRGFVMPTIRSDWGTKGLGRGPVITQLGIMFYAYGQYDLNRYNGVPGVEEAPARPYSGTEPQHFRTQVRAVLFFNFFVPTRGTAPFNARYKVRISSGDYEFAIKEHENIPGSIGAKTFTSFNFVGDTATNFNFPHSNQGVDLGGYFGTLFHSGTTVGGFAPGTYPFQSSNEIVIEGNSFDFQGGDIKIEFYEAHTDTLLQTYHAHFPNSNGPWPIPYLWGGSFQGDGRFDPHANKGYVPPGGSDEFLHNPLLFSSRHTSHLAPRRENGDLASRNSMFGRRVPSEATIDVLRTVELIDGDARLVAGLSTIGKGFFVPGEGYHSFDRLSGTLRITEKGVLLESGGSDPSGPGRPGGQHVDVSFRDVAVVPALPKFFGSDEITSLRDVDWSGDFDTAYGLASDGPYVNKPDEGYALKGDETSDALPYYQTHADTLDGQRIFSWDPRTNGFFSPTRQIPSPIMLGSLPAGVKRSEAAYTSGSPKRARPWETLLFSPVSQAAMVPDSSGNLGHPGSETPHDHYLLDLFTMPVVEPYVITEPFSTAGKINLNQRIIPFRHIKRETGLHGLLQRFEFEAIPQVNRWGVVATYSQTPPRHYKVASMSHPLNLNSYVMSLHPVNIEATMDELAKVLDPGGNTGVGAFHSASQISDVFLIPTTLKAGESIQEFWEEHQLTGDNIREAAYNHLYSLVTTRSNTFQIHYRVQTLQAFKNRANFDPSKDFAVTGEQRGSHLVERYLDVNDPRFNATPPEEPGAPVQAPVNTDTTPLNQYYEFRLLRHNRFSPGA